jgi:DNA-binding NtrC family response regulator
MKAEDIRRPAALLVEDDAGFRTSLAALVRAAGFDVQEAGGLAEARAALAATQPDLVLLDLELPDGHGLALKLEDDLRPDTPFVVVSGDGSARARRSAARSGAAEFLPKPVDPARLQAVLHGVLAGRSLRAEVADLRRSLRDAGRFGRLVGRSPSMQHVYDLILRVGPTSAPVLITGESGTGKELVAETIHDMSPRTGGPFVAVNCGAIPETLIESRLFGHEKGAFTGAEARTAGVFEQADGGTLLLDEIGEMPGELQVRLLRVLESESFTRVGGTEPIDVDVRVLAATNRDPRRAMQDGRLREDLFHRLNVFPIDLPPLRARPGDVELLAQHILQSVNETEGVAKRFDPRALAHIERHAWPGNVRELRNAVQRAWILADDVIRPELLPLPDAPAGSPAAAQEAGSVRIPVGSTVAEAERLLVLATLEACGGNKRKTASTLGISVRTLYTRLHAYGVLDGPG